MRDSTTAPTTDATPEPRASELARERVRALACSDPQAHWRAQLALMELGFDARDAAYDGLSSLDWRIRAGCAGYMDHFADDRCVERVILCMSDPKRKVRWNATHAVGCHRCKPSPISIDVVRPLLTRLDEDKSIRVRRMAAQMLLFQPRERRIVKRFHRLLREEQDEKLRKFALWGLAPSRTWGVG